MRYRSLAIFGTGMPYRTTLCTYLGRRGFAAHSSTLGGADPIIFDPEASMSTSPDYASYLGIHSEAAAIVLVVVYAPLMIWFIHQSIKHPTYVHIVLALFCASTLFHSPTHETAVDSFTSPYNLL